jgi:lysozyme
LNAPLRTGPRGLSLIKRYENLRLAAYKPTPNDVWTIGYGHTRGVGPGDTCTEQQANAWLREDCRAAEQAVLGLDVKLTQSMFDALVSLVFNVGPGAIAPNSTIGRTLREGNIYLAWAGFALWRKQSGKDLLGLARRRANEMALFLEDPLQTLD